MSDFNVNANRNSGIHTGGDNVEKKNTARDTQLKLERTLNGTRIDLKEFANVGGGRIDDAPKGTGKDSVEKKRFNLLDFVKNLGVTVWEGGKSFVDLIKSKLPTFGEKSEAAKLFDQATKDYGKEKLPDKNAMGLLFTLATESKDTKLMEKALNLALASAKKTYGGEVAKLKNDSPPLGLAGGNIAGRSIQMSNEDLLVLKEVASAMLPKRSEFSQRCLEILIESPSMTDLVDQAFDKEINKNQPKTLFRQNDMATTDLAIHSTNGIKFDYLSTIKEIFGTQENKDFLVKAEGHYQAIVKYDEKLKECKNNQKHPEVLKLKGSHDTAKEWLATRPNDKEACEGILRISQQLFNAFLGNSPNSVRNQVTQDYKDYLDDRSQRVIDSNKLPSNESRNHTIEGLYQNALILRGLNPAITTNESVVSGLSGGEKRVLLMASVVLQSLANGTMHEPKKTSQEMVNISGGVQASFDNLMSQTTLAIGRREVG